MTDKFEAIHSFWASFGIPAYDENTVPTGDDRPAYPYITYSAAVSEFWDGPVALSGSLWYYGSSWAAVTAKLEDLPVRGRRPVDRLRKPIRPADERSERHDQTHFSKRGGGVYHRIGVRNEIYTNSD